MARFFKYMAAVLAFAGVSAAASAQQIRARVSGLENNAEYMRLLAREQAVSRQADSLTAAMEGMRQQFRTDTASRNQISSRILESEEKLFALRNSIGQLSQRISSIEQQWIIQHLSEGGETEQQDSGTPAAPVARQYANIVLNRAIADNLTEEDYGSLLAAQNSEEPTAAIARLYAAQNGELVRISRCYDTVSAEAQAQRLMEMFDSLQTACLATEDSLLKSWGSIFDNKTYAYSYIADKNNRTELLSEFNRVLDDMRSEQNMQDGQWASDVMTAYYLQKRVVIGLERHIADLFSLDKAADSLQGALSALQERDFFLPQVGIEERLFLDYQDISIHSPSLYNSRNPIPECRVYPRGTIYRIRLGSFSVPQTPALFKGVAPLSYLKENGRYTYFVGGFATDSSARQAQIEMKDIGFKRPEIVVWKDGVFRNISKDGEMEPIAADTMLYSLTIEGLEAVDDSLKSDMDSVGRMDILKNGSSFIIAPIEGRSNAERVQEAVLRRHRGAVTRIAAIEN